MQAKGKHSDRRRNKKRRHNLNPDPSFEVSLPDQSRRYGDRRCDQRRRNVRLNLPFEVSLPDQDGKTMNVSASGVYFEVITNDIAAYSPGTIIPLQINTVTNTPGSRERKLRLIGRGTVIRNCIIENPGHDSSLRVALEFTKKLNLY